jgi:transposase
MGRKRKKYPREFKLEAVRQLESSEISGAELARRLGVTQGNLVQWRAEFQKKQADAFPGSGNQGGVAGEIARLKRELAQVTEERDILKKAAVYFAKVSK